MSEWAGVQVSQWAGVQVPTWAGVQVSQWAGVRVPQWAGVQVSAWAACRCRRGRRGRRGRRARPATCRVQLHMEGCGGEWFGVPVPRLFLFVGALHPIRRHYTPSVGVQRHVTGAAPRNGCSAPCLWRLSGLWGSSELGLSSGLGLSSAWGLCGASCCGSSKMSHVIPRHVFQTLKSHRWNSAVFSIPMKS